MKSIFKTIFFILFIGISFTNFAYARNGTIELQIKINEERRRENERIGREVLEGQRRVREAEANKKRQNEIFESEIQNYETICVRSFVNTNYLSRRCLKSIQDKYCKINGAIFQRSFLTKKVRIIQHVGYCQYIAELSEYVPPRLRDNKFSPDFESIGWFQVTLGKDDIADDETALLSGFVTDDLYEYTAVNGTQKRIKIFKVIKSSEMEELTIDDVVKHLSDGKTFTINLDHIDQNRNVVTAHNVKISKNEGKIVLFGRTYTFVK